MAKKEQKVQGYLDLVVALAAKNPNDLTGKAVVIVGNKKIFKEACAYFGVQPKHLETARGWVQLDSGHELFWVNTLKDDWKGAVARKLKEAGKDAALYCGIEQESLAVVLVDHLLPLGIGSSACGKIPSYQTEIEPIWIAGSTNIQRVNALARALSLTRGLVNLPANTLGVSEFAETALALVEQVAQRKEIEAQTTVTFMDHQDCASEQMGLLLGVGQGAAEGREPGLLCLELATGAKDEKFGSLIGKGIVFDSGGYCLKPGDSMKTMNSDMAGAASVLAGFLYAQDMGLKINLRVYMPLAENMVSSRGIRPGDILVSRKGDTVEVGNTDAEGRLILADALNYAADNKRTAWTITVATLTGAAKMALGEKMAALFCEDDGLSQELNRAASSSLDKIWPLPMGKEFEDCLKSDKADLNNSAGVGPGATSGAMFLRHFANKKAPFAHLDIAGVARSKDGATGRPTLLVCTFLENSSQ